MSPSSPALGVHKSTASRLVAALEKWELVEQVEGRGKYRLGIGLLRLAGTAVAGLDVVEQARPVCRRLAAETAGDVNLAVLSDNHALIWTKSPGPRLSSPTTGSASGSRCMPPAMARCC